MKTETLRDWIDGHREQFLDVLRIYLGFALLAKGISFVREGSQLMETVKAADVGFDAGLLAHVVVLAHIGGGLLLAIGLVTRLAAAVQVPVIGGAIFFIHRKEGLFTPAMTLEFTLLVLFLLLIFVVVGSGRWSVDHYLFRKPMAMPRATTP